MGKLDEFAHIVFANCIEIEGRHIEVSKDLLCILSIRLCYGIRFFADHFVVDIEPIFYILDYNQYSAVKDYIDDFGPDITDITRKKFGMRLPVMIGYHFDITKKFKIYLYTGPELEVGFVAKDQIKGYTYRPFTKWQNVYGDEGSLKRVDVLWGYGLGLSYSKFYCGFGGSQGLVNMLKNSDLRMRELHIYFQIGLNF